jgi:hypothetical protein
MTSTKPLFVITSIKVNASKAISVDMLTANRIWDNYHLEVAKETSKKNHTIKIKTRITTIKIITITRCHSCNKIWITKWCKTLNMDSTNNNTTNSSQINKTKWWTTT